MKHNLIKQLITHQIFTIALYNIQFQSQTSNCPFDLG